MCSTRNVGKAKYIPQTRVLFGVWVLFSGEWGSRSINMFTLIFSSLLQTTQSILFNQSSSSPALPPLQLAEQQLYNTRQRNPRLNSLAWAHPSLAWALIKTKIFPAVWIKNPQTWATRQDCSSAAAAGRCQFAAQVSTLGISPFSSNQKINSSHSTQANYFFCMEEAAKSTVTHKGEVWSMSKVHPPQRYGWFWKCSQKQTSLPTSPLLPTVTT